MATNFRAKFGYQHSFNKVAFQNVLSYCHSDSKILYGHILATIYANLIKIGPSDYNTTKMVLSHRVSQKVLGWSSPNFQCWWTYVCIYCNFDYSKLIIIICIHHVKIWWDAVFDLGMCMASVDNFTTVSSATFAGGGATSHCDDQ